MKHEGNLFRRGSESRKVDDRNDKSLNDLGYNSRKILGENCISRVLTLHFFCGSVRPQISTELT